MPSWLPIDDWRDIVDIALVAGFCWLAIRYFRSAHAQPAIAGLAFLGIVYLFARSLELRLAATLFQGFFAVVVLVLVVVFQEDLRRVFEQLGSWWRGNAQVPTEMETADLLVRSVARLAATRTGALIVVPGQEPVERHLEGGIRLDGRISEPLLLSLFDASSPGHDGAVLLSGSIVERFAVHLPLSANRAMLGPGGTRHAAALGLAERCDATCIVVSEERGTISVGRDAELRILSRPEDLITELRRTSDEEAKPRPWWRARIGLDTVLAVAGAVVLWMVLIPGSDVSEATVEATIELTNLPRDHEFESVEPETVNVTLRGLRRDLLLADRASVSVVVDAYLARFGRRTFALAEDDVRKPDSVSVVSIEPDKLRLSLIRTAASDELNQ